MNLETLLIEFRKGWKGFTIFLLVVVLIVGGMAQLYPSVNESFEEDTEGLEGERSVHLETEEDVFRLSWEEVDGAEEYVVIEDESAHMATSKEIKRLSSNTTVINRTEDSSKDRYFAVIAVVEDSRVPVGTASTEETKDMFEEMMDTPYFRMFTAGRSDVRMDEIEGFLSVEVYSWWILLVGVYLSYLSVKSVTDDYEESRMDIIFSTPLSKRRYLMEKFSAYGIFSLLLVVVSGLVLTLSVYSVGEGFRPDTFLLSLVISWPMLLVIVAVSMFFAVLTQSSKIAVGATFAVILVQYALFMAGHMLKSLKPILPFTICNYWDYNSVLLDGVFKPGHFVGLLLLTAVIFFGAVLIFAKEDIPA